ncbi:hypothetical protein L3Y34_009054 [Caenorhabditis briggsae]|uniref:Uncharacterized protein n=1 Tax=Caenorhabditis briggsae TaxID=6238 RepID=A0AAE9A1M0_CAEBR|nr:hypothetical protein L3Y34_009054 [Caenorhabditis briggsae]
MDSAALEDPAQTVRWVLDLVDRVVNQDSVDKMDKVDNLNQVNLVNMVSMVKVDLVDLAQAVKWDQNLEDMAQTIREHLVKQECLDKVSDSVDRKVLLQTVDSVKMDSMEDK